MAASVVDRLLKSDEPSIRWLTRTRVLGEPPDSPPMHSLQREIARSPRVRALLTGCSDSPGGPYAKWRGTHWVLSALADLGHPAGDVTLAPMFDRVLRWWLARRFYLDREAQTFEEVRNRQLVPVMQGRHRRCASQQGNALRFLMVLGCVDDRVGQLVERLLHWQWPDGGWNCDRRPEAHVSSFEETWLPLRALSLYGRQANGSTVEVGEAQSPPHQALESARRAAEVFLTRRLMFRRRTGSLVKAAYAHPHYPRYWHYDYLAGLVAMTELGGLDDARCADALNRLESQRLPDGGWATSARHYYSTGRGGSRDSVQWGPHGDGATNEWVTVDALFVLQVAGRLG